MAVPTADGLAKAAVAIGRAFHRGDPWSAMNDLDELVTRLQRFLNYVVLAEQLLGARDPSTSAAVRDYKCRVFDGLDGLEAALVAGDTARAGVELARGLATALLEYRGIAGQIEAALGQPDQRVAA